jgi:hypothetical protein
MTTFFFLLASVAVAFHATFAPASAQTPVPADAQSFYVALRSAALSGRTDSVAALVRFPLQTRGVMDGDPVLKHDARTFPKLLPKLLDADAGVDGKTNMRQLLASKPALTPNDANGKGRYRVANFVFERTKTGWRWVFAYWSIE